MVLYYIGLSFFSDFLFYIYYEFVWQYFKLYNLLEQELSEELLLKVRETFKIFDIDGSKSIDKEEAVKHWKTKFGKLSAKEFFNQVDVNNDGEISEVEFIEFWKIVKGAHHTEEEIDEELQNI